MRALSELPIGVLTQLVDQLAPQRSSEITRTALLAGRLEDAAAIDELMSLPPAARLPVLRAVLATRQSLMARAPELVWTGPDRSGDGARRTAQVVRELFGSAQRHVLISGYALRDAADLLAPLHARMLNAGVRVDVYLSVDQDAHPGGAPRAMALSEVAERAWRHIGGSWPWTDAVPRVLVDARLLDGREFCSIHAKAIVVDSSRALVTSANLTERAMERNVEIGVVLHDPTFASELVGHFDGARRDGRFVEVGRG